MQTYTGKALKTSKAAGNKVEQDTVYQNLGTSRIILRDYDKALRLFTISDNLLVTLNQDKKIKKY